MTSPLPDLFTFADDRPVASPADWPARRQELSDLVVGIEYGGMPPAPEALTSELLHGTTVARFGGASYTQYHLTAHCPLPVRFRLDVLVPQGDGPLPVILNGDGCWRYTSDAVTEEVLRRGNILAQFSRVEIVPDAYNDARDTGLYLAYPELRFGALSAWAWGYHRCVDFLETLPAADSARIAVVGHSRGGKTSLLAGATDERIALTSANDSGSGGAGCYHLQGPESETLEHSIQMIAYWYGPRLAEYLGREQELPFDQHSLKALVAPRPLLTTEALGDLWANPSGTWQTHLAASKAWEFLGTNERPGIWYREGGHDHGLADWTALLDFVDWKFRGIEPPCDYATSPFPEVWEG
jgi:hypothetical protein